MQRSTSGLDRSLFTLLARGAPLGELRAAADSATAEMSPEDRAEAVAHLELAVNLHDEIEDLRRRSHEIEALVLTVADVTALRDLDGALHAICARARSLLAADVAWLQMVDASRTYTREFAVDGALTPEFNAMMFHENTGMSGRVVDERRTWTTDDYLQDTTFEHSDDFDRAFAAEGVRAVVCVPMRRGAQIVGVLLSGSRTPRGFTQRDIGQLEILAAHAAIVLENGRLFDETQRTLSDLKVAEQQAREHAAALEHSFELDEELMKLVVQGAGLEAVCAAVATVLGGSLVVLDLQGRVSVSVGPAQDGYDLRLANLATRADQVVPGLRAVVDSARGSGMPVSVEPESVGACSRVAVSMHAGDEPLGELLFAGTNLPGSKRLLIRVAAVIALVIIHGRDLEAAERRSRDVLMSDLLGDSGVDDQILLRRAGRLGLDLSEPLCVFALDLDPSDAARAVPGLSRLAGEHHGLAADYARGPVVLMPGVDPRDGLRRIQECLPRGLATIGAAGPAHGVATLAASYREARRTLELLRALGRRGVGASVADLGFFGAVLPHTDVDHVSQFIEDTLGPIEAYDAERGTDLFGTLAAYFATSGHLADTAAVLPIHINTLYQRLERIASLLGSDWRAADNRLQLHLAVRLREISRAIENPQ